MEEHAAARRREGGRDSLVSGKEPALQLPVIMFGIFIRQSCTAGADIKFG